MEVIRAVGVLVFRGDKVLLVKHGESSENTAGFYGIPAGRVEDNERDIDAALREMKEETGLDANSEDLVELPTLYEEDIDRGDGVKNYSLEVFLCRKISGEFIDNEECEPEWVKIEEVANLDLLPNVEKIISEGLNFS